MHEQSSFERELEALRRAAAAGDWNSCRESAETLLLRLPSDHALRLTRDFVARRLPAFERQQPGVSWPHELLGAVEGVSIHREKHWPDAEFPAPGCNSFIKALDSLWNAILRKGDDRQCAAELVDALSEAIMAEKLEHWGSRHPDEWALWYQLAWSDSYDPRKTDIMISMAKDPDVTRLARAGWLEVADQLEAAIRERARKR